MNSDAFELNKIIGATLFALLVFFAARTLSDIIFAVHAPETPGYEVAVTETEAGRPPKELKAAVPLPQLLAQASAEKGASVAKKCAACHTFEQGGPNKVGPNLHGIIGRPIASQAGFSYSPAMQEYKGKAGTWTYKDLNEYLTSPKAVVPGTKMAFAGIPNDGQRADLILYLREQSPSAPPLPEVKEQAPAAEGEKAAATPEKEAAPPAAQEPAPQAPAAQEPAPQAPAAQEPAPQQEQPAATPSEPAPAAQEPKPAQ